MRRIVCALVVGLLVALGSVGLGGAGAATAAASNSASNTQVSTSTDDFTFASFEADYYLARDSEHHSTLRTVETLVAEFPQTDQNRGIRRAIPNHYNGQPVDLSIVGVTDQNGDARNYETEEDEDNDDLTIVTIAADHFVHAAQTYAIEYTQRYVTQVPDDATSANANEFYWDVNGVGWAQSFGTVTARVHLDSVIADHFTGRTACYQGAEGSRAECADLQVDDQSGGVVIEASAAGLAPHENLSVAVGFGADTFVPRDDAYLSSGTGYLQLAGLAGLIVAGLIALIARLSRWRDHPGRGTIIPEYLPPKDVNPLVASNLHGAANKATAAEFLNLAVRHNIRVLEEPSKSALRAKPRYVLELVTASGLQNEELSLASALFGSALTPGSRRDLSKTDAKLGPKIYKIAASARKKTISAGYRRKPVGHMRSFILWLSTISFTLAIVFGVITAAQELGGPLPFLLLVATGILYVVTMAMVSNVRPVTEKGAELRDYLRGLEMYIKLAEADRLRVLQSPQGALRTEYRPAGETPWSSRSAADLAVEAQADAGQVDTAQVDTGQIVKLYEKLLPYAVLFGLEKEWSKQLGEYYDRDNSQPDWYYGSTAFNAGLFAVGIGALSATASSSWSGSSTSSSGGGSGGGGFSGGGGGGGGGGGV